MLSQTEQAAEVDAFPDQDLCNEPVDLYFDLIHDKQHALFHRPSFIASQRAGLAARMLVAGMMALAARFSSNTFFAGSHPWARGRRWADHAKFLFDNRFEPVSLMTIQACSLLSIIAFVEGDMATESLYGALAIRMVHILDLQGSLSPSGLEREIEVRVLWNIWMMDNWTAAGARLPQEIDLLPAFPKPMDELVFEGLTADDDFSPVNVGLELSAPGMWAHMIPLTEVIVPINSLHESTVSGRLSGPETFQRVEIIANKLDSWLLRLPQHLRATPENLQRYAIVGHGRTLVALHLGFHHHSQLLYYQFLRTGQRDPAEPSLARIYAERCKEHATALSDLLWLARSLPGCDCKWSIIGHLLVVSSSISLHTLMHSDEAQQTEHVREKLTHNFEMIIELRAYWPSIYLSMSRLRSFHQALSDGVDTHQMDHWMLIFLQRYMAPVRDRAPMGTENLVTWPSPLQMGDDGPSGDGFWEYQSPLSNIGTRILDTFL